MDIIKLLLAKAVLPADAIKKLGADAAHDLALNQIKHIFDSHASAIAVKMQAEGWTFDKKTTPEIIRDAQFRLWRVVFHFNGGGFIADTIRDAHEKKILAAVTEKINTASQPNTSLAQLVELVGAAELELTF